MVCCLVSTYFDSLDLAYNKNKLYKTSDYWSRAKLNFDFLGNFLGIVSPQNFVYNILRKIFFLLYTTNCPSFIDWLPLFLEILGKMCIAIVCFPGRDVINLEINHIFLINSLSTWPRIQDKNLNIFKTKTAFKLK